ncbi:hypothetical protein A2867_01925 [Candidatus Daviesbacteria bacterium RIFCSPHIGHO2_01_FULL_40_11]|uniref:Uncharacterized protein n=1 Tax=Candidatus Daviesbacteria bacterium RIFCSPHIGHO2_01_FULL_40_11 TaxID=1797762 RepID=A0A1F5JGS4_9BACT|nr:MAG: hypothetical protein A2867_01925 [Candidatus Daviesbacteria bacterium RIFCSPHIGHO2_01_FULL_40_11]
MILWLILFLLIIGISFILAFRSMKDYQEIPKASKVEYGLFLIRRTDSFDAGVLGSIGKFMLDNSLIISLERLFKGNKAALTIFGPKEILNRFSASLSLLELEDYILDCQTEDLSIWEVGVKENTGPNLDDQNNIFANLSQMGDEDQFFWQVILGSRKEKDNISFQTQIRAVVYSKDPSRKKILTSLLQGLKLGKLAKIPKPFSTEQMMDFFRSRSLSKDSNGPILDSVGVMRLLKV